MATKNCSACNTLQEKSADFVQNGVTTAVCTSLKNDTGFSASNGNDDCADLDLANDCLIGNMEDEIDAYEVCDWKTYMHKLVHNLWNMLKAIICAICGIWTNIHNLWNKVNKHDCEIDYLYNGASFALSETSDTDSYVVAGKGVSFLERSSGGQSSDVNVQYIAGGLGRTNGSLRFHSTNWTDPDSGYNYDTDSTDPRKTSSRLGNEVWKESAGSIDSELVYEMRIKQSEYPQIKSIYSGFGQEADAGAFHVAVLAFNDNQYAHGQHGTCNTSNGDPVQEGYSRGHKVKSGYIYLQMRMTAITKVIGGGDSTTANITPRAFIGMRMSQNALDCD